MSWSHLPKTFYCHIYLCNVIMGNSLIKKFRQNHSRRIRLCRGHHSKGRVLQKIYYSERTLYYNWSGILTCSSSCCSSACLAGSSLRAFSPLVWLRWDSLKFVRCAMALPMGQIISCALWILQGNDVYYMSGSCIQIRRAHVLHLATAYIGWNTFVAVENPWIL